MTPLLSIVIPNYNYGHYLPSALNSILEQEYTNYEIIIIDDGSTDNSRDIISQYCKKYPQIRALFKPKNEGVFIATKEGFELAKGSYIHSFTADDLYLPGFLTSIVNLIHKYPHAKMICSDIIYFQDGKEIAKKNELKEVKEATYFNQNEVLSHLQQKTIWVPGISCVFHKSVIHSYGLQDRKLENIADWYYFHNIALQEGMGYVPEPLIAMRQHSKTYTSIVKRDKKRRRATYYYLLNLLSLPNNKKGKQLFIKSGILNFIYKELRYKLLLKLKYRSFWPFLLKKL